MLVLEIEFLTGRYVAKRYDDHDAAEWPPHPARVFSALAAVHYEDPIEGEAAQKTEREALEWLPRQPAPSIYASEAAHRRVLHVFVPANDKSVEPGVNDAVHEVLFGADERTKARARRKLEETCRAASEAVSPTDTQRDELIAGINEIEQQLKRNGSCGGSALESLQQQATAMAENRPSKLLAAASKAIARLNRTDRNELQRQLGSLKRKLHPGKELIKRALSVLPAAAERKQARTFPSVSPYDPVVQMIWHEEPTHDVREALDRLAARVTRLGHSSSLVRLAWGASPRDATWIPDPRGAHPLRWVSDGQLAALDAAFELHRGTANRVLPSVPANYRRADDPEPAAAAPRSNVFGTDWIVFELLGSKRLPIVRAVDAAMALRGAALAHAGAAPPEVLSGHGPRSGPSQRPHVAYVAQPFVGFPHADGSILGVAALLPRALLGEERRAVLRAFGSITRLTLPGGFAFDVRRVAEPRPHLRTLDPLLWCEEGVVWGTVTPILLDRFPGDLRSRDAAAAGKAEQEAEEAVVAACERIGLPRPRAASLATICFLGSAAADRFRRRNRQGLPPRVRVHALIDFGQPVRGPVLLGAGRYVGLGLCRPLPEGRRS